MRSETISFLRFPLAVLVVFIHSSGRGELDMSFPIWEMTGMDVYNTIRTLVSHVLGQLAVPTFFLISGYLFFQHLDCWDWTVWKGKMKRRMWTLLIPYLLWIVIRWAYEWSNLSGARYGNAFSLAMFFHAAFIDTGRINWLGTHMSMSVPLHVPFWFIRDLIVLNVSTPFIYFFMKRFGAWIMALLTIAYLGDLWPTLWGFNISSAYFFTLGAWLSITKIKMFEIVQRQSLPIVLASNAMVLLLVFQADNEQIMMFISPIYVLVGVFATLILTNKFVDRYSWRMPTLLTQSTFFIFAFHIFVLYTLDGAIMRLGITMPETLLVLIFTYFLYPAIAIAISVLFYWMLHRYTPAICSLLTGKS